MLLWKSMTQPRVAPKTVMKPVPTADDSRPWHSLHESLPIAYPFIQLTELISQVNSNENTMKLNLKTFQKIPKTIFPEHFFRRNPKFSESVRTHLNAPRRIRIHPNVSEHVQTGPNRSEHVRKLRKTCENIETLRENVENFRETCEIYSVTSMG